MDLEAAYLRHIMLHLECGDNDRSILKTFLNSWFAHHAGGSFVSEGKALWLSRKATKRATASEVHAISHAARRSLAANDLDALVIDHTIPLAQIVGGLRSRHRRQPFTRPEDLRSYLARRFTLALITKAEHDVALAPWKAAMATGWCDDAFDRDESTRYCRYGPNAANFPFDIQRLHSPLS